MSGSLAPQRSETAFGDFKLPLLPSEAVAEANRCLFCHDAPCIAACPTAIDIPQFIRQIASGNDRGSARTIFQSNILGASCARVCPVEVLCVGACVYNHLDQPPIQIGRLQRHATDRALEEGWRFFEAGAPTGRRVALIGAGPASLAAAHELRVRGHACTIFERRADVGGLNLTGVAPYKMRAETAVAEAQWVLAIGGIELRTGVEVGRDITLQELERGFDAVFVGVGLGEDAMLRVPGAQLPGVLGAVSWIERMKMTALELAGVRRCVVVGGGNTALDAAREARGLGIEEVTLVYRGRRETASGYAHELSAALDEGARAVWQAVPVAFEGDARVERVRCVRLDEAKRTIPGTEFTVEADLVLVAIGQSRLGELFAGLEGLRIEQGRLLTDEHGFTGRRGWWAGGDCANGGKEVVNAAAEGKRAAIAIDAALGAGAGAGAAAGAAPPGARRAAGDAHG
ncbi:MAG: FAD-dependent oxidoreductase [Phycisphaerales bacterium]